MDGFPDRSTPPISASGQGMVHVQGAIRLPNGATKLTNAQSVTL